MSWVSSLCTPSDTELISMGSGLAFRNTSWWDQALGVWGLMHFWGNVFLGVSWAALWLEESL